jgi:hypothetical protein
MLSYSCKCAWDLLLCSHIFSLACVSHPTGLDSKRHQRARWLRKPVVCETLLQTYASVSLASSPDDHSWQLRLSVTSKYLWQFSSKAFQMSPWMSINCVAALTVQAICFSHPALVYEEIIPELKLGDWVGRRLKSQDSKLVACKTQ